MRQQFRSEEISSCLEKILDDQGIGAFEQKAASIYSTMRKKGFSAFEAGLVFLCLENGVLDPVLKGEKKEEVSLFLQESCGLNEEAASPASDLFLMLFNEETIQRMDEKKEEGFRCLCREGMMFMLELETRWIANTSLVCRYHVEGRLSVCDETVLRKMLSLPLEKDPYLKEEQLSAILEGWLEELSHADFDAFCNSDFYFEPYLGDYDSHYEMEVLNEFCGAHGLKVESFRGNGEVIAER